MEIYDMDRDNMFLLVWTFISLTLIVIFDLRKNNITFGNGSLDQFRDLDPDGTPVQCCPCINSFLRICFQPPIAYSAMFVEL